ncbi:MAG: glycosyltransferase, partial [Clostridiales bacterium]|nr:glycosyltransferase [Clostridiales bacterium]
EYDYEVVAVNDCSPDHVLDVLIAEAQADRKVKVIDLAKNGGRHNALMAGYHVAEGEFVVCVDDDCQCPLDRFWDLLAPLERGGGGCGLRQVWEKAAERPEESGELVQ